MQFCALLAGPSQTPLVSGPLKVIHLRVCVRRPGPHDLLQLDQCPHSDQIQTTKFYRWKNWTLFYWCLPQSPSLQGLDSVAGPMQSSPFGFLHCLSLKRIPLLHVALHSPHEFQSDHVAKHNFTEGMSVRISFCISSQNFRPKLEEFFGRSNVVK